MRAQIKKHTYERTEEDNRFQDREAHFVGAGAGETHMGMSEAPFCVEIYWKNAGPKAHKKHFVLKFIGKMPDPNSRDHALCEPAQAKRIWTSQKVFCCENLQQKCGARDHPELSRPFSSYPKDLLLWTHSLFEAKRLVADQKWMDPMIWTSQMWYTGKWCGELPSELTAEVVGDVSVHGFAGASLHLCLPMQVG